MDDVISLGQASGFDEETTFLLLMDLIMYDPKALQQFDRRVLDDQKMWRETLARIVRKHFNQLVPPVG